MVIYKTINLINKKIYVGQDLNNNPKYLGSGLLLNRAIKKYGKHNFKKEILEYCKSKDDLNNREIYWIDNLNAINEGYNITKGGSGGDVISNHPNSKQIKEKLRKSLKWSDDRRKKQKLKGKDNPMFGKTHSVETRKKIGSREYAKGEDHYAYGKTMSDETKKKLSVANKGKPGYWKGKNIPDSTRYSQSIKIDQFSLDNNFIKTWNSISDASRETGAKHISQVCKGKRKSSLGFIWKYHN